MKKLFKDGRAYTLVEIMVVILIIGILAAIGSPSILKASQDSRAKVCISNLRQIDSAKNQWAIEKSQENTTVPTAADLDPFIKGGTAGIYCPLDPTKSFGNSYSINPLSTGPTCKLDPSRHKLDQ